MLVIALLTLCVATASALPSNAQRIVGGSVTDIANYPSAAALLYTLDWRNFLQDCAGVILNQRSILTAAQCVYGDSAISRRIRLGSTYANNGGSTYQVELIFIHHSYDILTKNNDIAILRINDFITYSSVVQPALIGGELYIVPDDRFVRAIGWGRTSSQGLLSEQLRGVDLLTFNHDSCHRRYMLTGRYISNEMLCAGWSEGGRGQCSGDTGGPLYHNNVVIGLSSFSNGCGIGTFPSVYTRVNRFLIWIMTNA